MVGFPGVLAHQGGWDELLVIVLPIALFVILLRVANARAATLEQTPDHPDDGPADDGPADEPTEPAEPDR